MVPNPYIQILGQSIDVMGAPSAVICGGSADKSLPILKAKADKSGFALIRAAVIGVQTAADGYWTTDPAQMKSLRCQNQEWQLVGVTQDRHGAMMLGEAGADLILFGHLEPIIVEGDLELGKWWSDLFEVPCGVILNSEPSADWRFGEPGWPEFYAKADSKQL